MKAMFGFMRHALKLPVHWMVWLMGLMVINGVAPLFFLEHTEAVVVLAVFGVSAVAMISLFGAFGWVRLLGAGHALWLGLVPWLLTRVGDLPDGSGVRQFVLAVIAINGISATIDVVDVIRWIRGDREPQVTA